MILLNHMLIYNLLLFTIVLLPAGRLIAKNNINTLKSERVGFKWNIRLALVLLAIIIVAGLRESYVGTDYSGYLDYYNYILEHGKRSPFFKNNEMGWEYLNFIFAKAGILPEVFFGLIAGLIWFFFIMGSYKFQYLLPLMFFFIFTNGFFFWTLSGLRQSITIMMFFYAIKYIIEQRPLHYAIIIFSASLFHLSALIMLPVYFLGKIRFNQKIVFILFVSSLLLMGNEWFAVQIKSLIIFIAEKLDMLSIYLAYLESEKFALNNERLGSGLGVFLRIITALYILYKSKSILKKQPTLTIYFVLFFIGSILSNIFFSNEMIGRVLNYFNVCFAIVVASSIYYSTKKLEKIIALSLMIVYLLLYNNQIYNLFNTRIV